MREGVRDKSAVLFFSRNRQLSRLKKAIYYLGKLSKRACDLDRVY